MAWNISNKSFASTELNEKKARVSVGAPTAYNPSLGANKGYHDAWDIQRAYRDGVSKVTWVFRCIDVISSNQASLPAVFRKDNNPFGEIIRDSEVLKLFNSHANHGENSFSFRYRISAQLLMSSRGVFIEVVRSRDGTPIALHLLPPQNTSPIPSVEKFVSGFEVMINNTEKKIIPPENVIWIRRPHPLDPYLSMTPMEAAGVAIEVENLAKIYNRNFLLNDGRPGGLLVLRSEISEEDKDELRSRFRGNISRTGAVGVISADDGADFVDTAASPRDAAYIQMRTLTKEEILASFGVPESIIGNSANRTFSNAGEEGKVFWMETMSPHLDLIARSFDKIDPYYYLDFDTSKVPILILSKQDHQRFYLQEYQQGLISANEYRDATGRKKVVAELADSILANPNLTPIANTEKPMETQGQQSQSLEQQGRSAMQEQISEFSPDAGGFVPAGSVEGASDIEKPASEVSAELGSGDEKSLPFSYMSLL